MSFGFSVGDFIAILELANRARKEWADAPLEYASIRDETKILDNVLREIDDIRPHIELSAEQENGLTAALSSCEQVLRELEAIIQKYGAIQRSNSGFKNRIRKVWARIKLDPEDVRNLRTRMQSSVNLLGAVQDSIQRNLNLEIREIVRDQDRKINQQYRDAIANWLAPNNYAVQQANFITQRSADTGNWLLEEALYLEWLQEDNATLLCEGIPGSGKTILTATVIEDLKARFELEPKVSVAYHYCNYKRRDEQSLDYILSSLIRQVFEQTSLSFSHVESFFNKYKTQSVPPALDELITVFTKILGDGQRIFIVIDALDEFDNTSKQRDKLLDELFNIQNSSAGSVNILATSRQIPDILTRFSAYCSINIRATASDVERYLDGRILELPSRMIANAQLQQEIKNQIVDLVDGMFLLARLHFDSLRDKTTPAKIRKALQDLPRGREALSQAYTDLKHRIDGQLKGFRDLAHQTLLCITYAKEELTLEQIKEAMAIEEGRRFDELEDDFEDEDVMLEACAGLVVLDPETSVVRLVHFSAQEFLESIREVWLPNGKTEMAYKCLNYLSMPEYGGGWCEHEEFCRMVMRHAFLRYAAVNIGHHVEQAEDDNVEKGFSDLLLDYPYLQFLARFSTSYGRREHKFILVNEDWEDEPAATSSSEDDEYDSLRRRSASIDEPWDTDEMIEDTEEHNDERDQETGQMKVLVERKRPGSPMEIVDSKKEVIDAVMEESSTQAMQSKDHKTAHGLFSEDHISFTEEDEPVPQYEEQEPAPDYKEKEPPQIPQETRKYDVEERGTGEYAGIRVSQQRDFYELTPMHIAGHFGLVKMAESLRRDGWDLYQPDSARQTPLTWAIWGNQSKFVEYYLAQDHEGIVPARFVTSLDLNLAVYFDLTAIFRMLIQHEIMDVKLLDKSLAYDTAFSNAVYFDNLEIITKLMEREDLDINRVDHEDSTPLAKAAYCNSPKAVEALLKRPDVDVNRQSGTGQTALMEAAQEGNSSIVRMLLDYGVDVDLKDRAGKTALDVARESRRWTSFQVLYDHFHPYANYAAKEAAFGKF